MSDNFTVTLQHLRHENDALRAENKELLAVVENRKRIEELSAKIQDITDSVIETSQLRTALENFINGLSICQAENLRLVEENAKLVEVIRSVEWVRVIPDSDFCPGCNTFSPAWYEGPGDPHVHKPGCRIDAALRPVSENGQNL